METVYHPVGTCKTGTNDTAVVDSELRVWDVEVLRVVDAFVTPTIVSGNINAPVIMVAEKAADVFEGERLTQNENRAETSMA